MVKKVSDKFENRTGTGDAYGNDRFDLFASDRVSSIPNAGKHKLGIILENQKAVCEELSYFGQALLSKFGIDSEYLATNINNRVRAMDGTVIKEPHAILRVNGKIVDFNSRYKGVRSQKEYFEIADVKGYRTVIYFRPIKPEEVNRANRIRNSMKKKKKK